MHGWASPFLLLCSAVSVFVSFGLSIHLVPAASIPSLGPAPRAAQDGYPVTTLSITSNFHLQPGFAPWSCSCTTKHSLTRNISSSTVQRVQGQADKPLSPLSAIPARAGIRRPLVELVGFNWAHRDGRQASFKRQMIDSPLWTTAVPIRYLAGH